jgi:AcrR family transcriptional regulator
LNQCFDLFADNGYASLTTRQIAKVLGVSTGTLYYYFPSKEDLFMQLIEELTTQDLLRAAAEIEGLSTLRERILALGDFLEANEDYFVKQTLLMMDFYQQAGVGQSRVNEAVQKRILSSSDFLNQFVPGSHCEAFVMAIDIRRSTELRLKARDPQAFAAFLSSLCQKLAEVVKAHDGVFNQFTGDGILAYFPHFLGGVQSGAHAVNAALECHQVWLEHYRQHRHVFRTVLLDVGLGIGIDHGEVTTVEVAELITVTGEPMVYACRLSGAPAGATYLNQPAYEQIQAHRTGQFQIHETNLHVKHEGSTLAYAITAAPAAPDANSAAPGA